MNRVTNIAWRTASGSRLGGFAYRYDALGRIVSLSHDLGGASFDRDYAYDDMDRLASDGGTAYAYDAAGNRASRTEDGETVSYALGQGDRLASWTGGSYQYDAAGCVTRITRGADTWDLAWNGQYQLVSVSTNGAFAEAYAYDALGRRVTTRNAGGTERHVYDDSWQVVADLDEDGNVIRSYVWGEGIDRLLAVKIGSRTYTVLTDVQGTVWGYADEQGDVVARWTYDAWGNVLTEEIAEGATELRAVRYRFQGRERSAATGLANFRMRWYDAVTGRWLSKDPIGLSGGLNLYAFCSSNPIRYGDFLGECKFAEDEKDCIRVKEILTGGFLFLDIYFAYKLHEGGKSMDYQLTDPASRWIFQNGSIRNPNQMGNYMAGYDAGYSQHPCVLYIGVRVGGMIYGGRGNTEGWCDAGSISDINSGFFDGVGEKTVNDILSDPFVSLIQQIVKLFN